jgi:hypothetical protein
MAVLIVVGVTGIAALKARGEKITERELRPEIVAPPSDEPAETIEVDVTTPGRVVLDLWHAEFQLWPAKPGESLRVEATYDENAYELVEEFEPAGENGWVYRVTFRRTGNFLMTALQQMFSGSSPRATIYLPADLQIDLDIGVHQGALEGDLGGLWLRSGEIDLKQGGIRLTVDEPLREPMERLAIDFSMGGGQVSRLGNASPKQLDLEFSMGGGEVDLRGAWVQDSKITIDMSMGGAVVRLPRDVLVEGVDKGGLSLEEVGEIAPPKLTIEVTGGDSGDIEFID